MKYCEIISFAEYYDIICELIYRFNMQSLAKIVFLAASVKKMDSFYISNNQKYNNYFELYSGVNLCVNASPNDFSIVFYCLKLLEDFSYIKHKNGVIEKNNDKKPPFASLNRILKSPKMICTINDLSKISDSTLIEEIIDYV